MREQQERWSPLPLVGRVREGGGRLGVLFPILNQCSKRHPPLPNPPHKGEGTFSGFTLVEMAVVLVIIGLLMMTVFPALTITRQSTQRTVTEKNLQSLMLATAAYVQANGCVPCPTPATATGAAFGRVRGDVNAAACNGCATAEGVPPFVSLGVPASLAHDGWGRWMTMRVDPALTTATLNIVPPTAACTAADITAAVPSCTQVNASQKGLCRTGLSATARVNVQTLGGAAQKAAVLFLSHGSQGYGAFFAAALPAEIKFNNGCRLNFPDIATACVQTLSCANPGSGSDIAQCNATGNNQFVTASARDGYDDMMLYADRNSLVSMVGNAACQTVW